MENKEDKDGDGGGQDSNREEPPRDVRRHALTPTVFAHGLRGMQSPWCMVS
jgi:hypothetical protein